MKILFLLLGFYFHLFAESCIYEPSDIDFKDSSAKNYKRICYNSHFIYYDKEHKVPAIVEYKYNQKNYIDILEANKKVPRNKIPFRLDNDNLEENEQNNPNEYQKTAFDRGHLAPYVLTGISEKEKKDVNKMSNIAPQRAYLNRTCWRLKELDIKNRVEKGGENLTIIVGVIFNKNSNKVNDLHIPEYFYMVIKNDNNIKDRNIIIYKNEFINKNECNKYFSDNESELEKLLGIDFYPDRIN